MWDDILFLTWNTEVSQRFQLSQIKAALKVNDEMLKFYWSIGRYLSDCVVLMIFVCVLQAGESDTITAQSSTFKRYYRFITPLFG